MVTCEDVSAERKNIIKWDQIKLLKYSLVSCCIWRHRTKMNSTSTEIFKWNCCAILFLACVSAIIPFGWPSLLILALSLGLLLIARSISLFMFILLSVSYWIKEFTTGQIQGNRVNLKRRYTKRRERTNGARSDSITNTDINNVCVHVCDEPSVLGVLLYRWYENAAKSQQQQQIFC